MLAPSWQVPDGDIHGTRRRADSGMSGRRPGMMGRMTTLGDTVEQVLRATEGVLAESPEASISSTAKAVRDLLTAGEDVVAYEILCDNLYEIDARYPEDIGRELRQAVMDAGADPSRVELLIS